MGLIDITVTLTARAGPDMIAMVRSPTAVLSLGLSSLLCVVCCEAETNMSARVISFGALSEVVARKLKSSLWELFRKCT